MIYGNKKPFLLTTLLGLITLFFVASFVNAQTPSNFDVTVSPVFFDLSANPGGKVSDRIRVRNNTNSPIPLKIEIKKLTGDTTGDLVLRDDNSDNSLSWIKFEEITFIAKPLEWTNVPFSIDIPGEAAYGYYYAVTFKQDENSPLAKTGAKITGGAAVPILLTVRKEGAKFEGKFVSFKTDAGWYEYPPIKIKTTFENVGNVHIRPHGNIFIKDSLGRQVAVLDLNAKQSSILPNTKKVFDSIWNDSFITREPKMEGGQVVTDKNGNPKTELKIRFDKILDLRVGKYTATALIVVSTDNKDIPFQAQTSFFVFPWKVIIGAVLFVIFAGIGFFNTFRNFVKRILKVINKKGKEEKV
jgi:hypothetical protein